VIACPSLYVPPNSAEPPTTSRVNNHLVPSPLCSSDLLHSCTIQQAVFVLALLPLITAIRGLPLESLPQVLLEGGRVLAGQPAQVGGAVLPGAPLFPAAYVLANVSAKAPLGVATARRAAVSA
jgi:hypothetical protein